MTQLDDEVAALDIAVIGEAGALVVDALFKPKIAKKLAGESHKRGWGLQIMRSMSDDFRIDSNHGGTRIKITKLLS